jgi:hypothetical protein
MRCRTNCTPKQRLSTVVAAAACLWVPFAPAPAGAAQHAPGEAQPATTIEAAGTSWVFGDDLGTEGGSPAPEDSCLPVGRPGFGLTETSGPSGPDDAVDHAALVWVGGRQFSARGSIEPAEGSDPSPAVAAGPQALAGLDVTVAHTPLVGGDPTVATLRTFVTLENRSVQAVSTSVEVVTNLGSDAATTVWADADGDDRATADDRWVATADDDDLPSDPIVATATFGPGRVIAPVTELDDQVFDCADTDGIRARYEVTVPAGETRHVASFLVLFRTGPDGDAAVPGEIGDAMARFGEPVTADNPAFAGIPADRLPLIVNWWPAPDAPVPGPDPTDESPAAPATPVPGRPTYTG